MVKATKASRLLELCNSPLEKFVLPQLTVSRKEWVFDIELQLKKIRDLHTLTFAVRSSSTLEDNEENSNAGKFKSFLNVAISDVSLAVQEVFDSYTSHSDEDEVLIQPYIERSDFSGVIFTRDPSTGSHYVVINYFIGEDTAAVTSGNDSGFVTFCIDTKLNLLPEPLLKFKEEIQEICSYFRQAVDIEFICRRDSLFIVQWRALSVNQLQIPRLELISTLEEIEQGIDRNQSKHPYLVGDTTYFGLMPDWNPAELIGTRPSPLALSLFRDLITDGIWAYERGNLGYRNVRSFPLLFNLSGHPYIDIRASINSLIPAELTDTLASKIANLYLDFLKNNQQFHDKVEFDVYLTCWSFDFESKIQKYRDFLGPEELVAFKDSLIHITKNMIKSKDRGLDYNLDKVEVLKRRFFQIVNSDLDLLSKIFWLIEDCKRYGTLPFSGIARMAFVATSLLDSLVTTGALPRVTHGFLMSTINSPAKSLIVDSASLDTHEFLDKYGHLRPGTFDIRIPSYSKGYKDYFRSETSKVSSAIKIESEAINSTGTLEAVDLLARDLELTGVELIAWCIKAIEARELCKFLFSRNISAALDAIQTLGSIIGYSVDDLSYSTITTYLEAYRGSGALSESLAYEIQKNLELFKTTRAVTLPPLILSSKDLYCFTLEPSVPNFIGQQAVTSRIALIDQEEILDGAIVVVERADPGYDWIFSRNIKGLVTCYGGANSHMAVRCKELDIPAAIGVGDLIFTSIQRARVVMLDCLNKNIRVVS